MSVEEDVVVVDEPLFALVVGQVGQLDHPFEVGLAGRARSKQDQERRRLVGLIAEGMDAAGRDVEKVVRMSVDPVASVVELERPRQDEERLGDRAVKVWDRPAALRCDVDAVEAVVAVSSCWLAR